MLQQGKISVSKWIKHQVLLDSSEMEACFSAIAPFELYNVSAMGCFEELKISQELFLQEYKKYIEALQSGTVPKPDQKVFSAVATVDPEAIKRCEIQPGRWMARSAAPLVQLQHHRFFASKMDHKVHSMVMSPESIYWGVQFSFPQILLDGAGVCSKTAPFPNAALFSKMLKWLRSYSDPTTFIFDGVKVGTPIRLGKKCFEWIHLHPQLKELDIQILRY